MYLIDKMKMNVILYRDAEQTIDLFEDISIISFIEFHACRHAAWAVVYVCV